MVVMDCQVPQESLVGMDRKAILGCMAEMVVMDSQVPQESLEGLDRKEIRD